LLKKRKICLIDFEKPPSLLMETTFCTNLHAQAMETFVFGAPKGTETFVFGGPVAAKTTKKGFLLLFRISPFAFGLVAFVGSVKIWERKCPRISSRS
jgi:hypothetical protein